MSSPPRPPRRSPPRRALHERSDSHANEISAPTIRIIGDSDAQIYASSPFPIHPSQILSPKGRRPGLGFEDGISVSYEDSSANKGPSPTKSSKGKARAGANSNGAISEGPTADTTQSPPISDETTQRSSIDARGLRVAQGIDDDERLSDEVIQLPSVPSGRDGRAEIAGPPSFTFDYGDNSSSEAITSKASHNSLSSADSSGTVVRTKARNRLSYSAFPPVPRPSSSRSGRSFSTPLQPTLNTSQDSLSPVSSSFTTPDRPVSSVPTYATLQPVHNNGFHLQYPVVRPPTVSGSWAESSISFPKRPLRMSDRNVPERWNPHLSTVMSEETEGGRSSASLRRGGSGGPSNTSSLAVDLASTSSNLSPPANPPYAYRGETASSSIRMVSEDGDNLANLPSPILRSQGSGFFSVLSGRKSTRDGERFGTQARPGSRGNMPSDSIPSWARNYYANGSRDAIPAAPGSSTEATDSRPDTGVSIISSSFPRILFNPRNRPREIDIGRSSPDSMAITPADAHDGEIAEIRGSPRRAPSEAWSPHLWQDRKSVVNRRSMFIEPSLDEQAEGHALSRRNAQIMLFVLGFIFPIAWVLAAFLPLPTRPAASPGSSPKGKNVMRDIEKALDPIDIARYENARWWRNVNRTMSVIGLLIIAAIAVLAVLALRMPN